MSLLEGTPASVTAAERHDEPQQQLRAVINVLVTAVVTTGIAAITLGWLALLVQGAAWLVGG